MWAVLIPEALAFRTLDDALDAARRLGAVGLLAAAANALGLVIEETLRAVHIMSEGMRLVRNTTEVLAIALGIVLLLESELGLSPWDVLNQGISEHTPLSFGTANTVVAFVVLGVGWTLGAGIGPGTVANAVLIGLTVDALLAIDAIDELSDQALGVRAALLVVGIGSIAVGSGFYIGADLGAGPRDSLMLVLALEHFTQAGIQQRDERQLRNAAELSAFMMQASRFSANDRGLFKQATEGDCSGSRPGFTDFVGRAKFDAWAALKGKSTDAAMQEYVDLIESLK